MKYLNVMFVKMKKKTKFFKDDVKNQTDIAKMYIENIKIKK